MSSFVRYSILFISFVFLASCSNLANPLVLRVALETTGLGQGHILGDALLSACEDRCSALVREGQEVSFNAVAKEGSSFIGWEGACAGTQACTLTVSENLALRAVFKPNGFLLKVETSGLGLGFVKAEAMQLNCSGLCEEVLTANERLHLVAEATVGSSFTGWGGACEGKGVCTLDMDSSKVVLAYFELADSDKATVQVEKLGSGTGKVMAEGIACGEDCFELFAKGKSLTLTAQAAPGSSFIGWSGACEGLASCSLKLIENVRIVAEFERTSQVGDLLITEIGAPQALGDLAWLELFNGSEVTLDLANYQLRSYSKQRAEPFGEFGLMRFDLPSRWLAPGEYVYVAARLSDHLAGPKQVYLLDVADTVPYWSESGFVELIRHHETVDMLRFGHDLTQALSATAWQGKAVASFNASYGQSLVRDLESTDTNSAADWRLTAFATPAGPNDVPARAQDADADGLPDSAEVLGGRFAGLDLYAMGARTKQKDIFVEIDHMMSTDAGILPQREALDKVVLAFAKRGIALHFDVGTLFNEGFAPAYYNLGAGESSVPFANSVAIPSETNKLAERANFYDYKAQYLDIRRKPIFHYLLMANSQRQDGQAGSSGMAELKGNDLMITMGNWGLNAKTPQAKNTLINFQASTLMHELGHNLGLKHGGDEHINQKPNYLSVMNYMYQLYGLGQEEGEQFGDRYYTFKRWQGYGSSKNICDLSHSPCSSDFVIDYSDGSSLPLVENLINEAAGLGRANVWLDYDNNGWVNTPKLDVNGDGSYDILKDHDDWANLFLPFQQTPSGMNLRLTQTNARALKVLQNDHQNWLSEYAPSSVILETIEGLGR